MQRKMTGKTQLNLNFHPFGSYGSILFFPDRVLWEIQRPDLIFGAFCGDPQPLATLCTETCFLWHSALDLNYGLGWALPEAAHAGVFWSLMKRGHTLQLLLGLHSRLRCPRNIKTSIKFDWNQTMCPKFFEREARRLWMDVRLSPLGNKAITSSMTCQVVRGWASVAGVTKTP